MSQNCTIRRAREFLEQTSGNVALIFSLALMPLMFLTGAAIDYGRAQKARANLQSAVDATVLALIREPRGTPSAQLQTRAEAYLAAMHDRGAGGATNIHVTVAGQTVRVSADAVLPTAFLKIAHVDTINLSATATGTYGRSKVQVALALDNTGSMGQFGKMPALHAAAIDLVTRLETMAPSPGDVKVSVAPFNTQVRIDASLATASWLRWDRTLENPNLGAAMASPPTPATWGGCISDRDQNYDITGERPIGGTSNYVAAKCEYGPLARTIFLTSDFNLARTTIASMSPAGATNITIGLATALATLTADSPFGDASSNDPDTQRYVILLTDGNNTQNRWGGTGYEGNSYVPNIDDRLSQACAQARNRGIQVFTVRVIDGNEPLLRSCATNPSMYFPATTAADIAPIFAAILQRISNARLTM